MLWQAVGLVFQFGYTITLPLVALALVGRFLDKKLNSSPILLLTAIIVSIIVSSVILFVKLKRIVVENYRVKNQVLYQKITGGKSGILIYQQTSILMS